MRLNRRTLIKTWYLIGVLVNSIKDLVILQFLNALLKLDLVSVLSNEFVFGHQVVLQLTFNKEF